MKAKKKKKNYFNHWLIKIITLSLTFTLISEHLSQPHSLTPTLTPASHSGLSLSHSDHPSYRSHSDLSLSQLRSPKLPLSLRSLTLSTPITQAADPPLLLTQLADMIGACLFWVFFSFFSFFFLAAGGGGGGCGCGHG